MCNSNLHSDFSFSQEDRFMPTKKPSIKATSKAKKTVAKVEDTKDKVKRTRKPAVERAQKLAVLINKKHAALTKLVGRWHGEATDAQQAACARLAVALGETADQLATLTADTAYLVDTGWVPTAKRGGGGGRKALAVGMRVMIKNKRYDPIVHGDNNLFEVVLLSDKNIVIRDMGGDREFPVPRLSIKIVSTDTADVVNDVGVDDNEDDVVEVTD
jgi:uncharacterized protein YukE